MPLKSKPALKRDSLSKRREGKHIPDQEIARVFETLDLATQEQREKVLSQGLVKSAEDVDKSAEARYVRRLSNDSRSPTTEE